MDGHIGIVACSIPGAALCYQTICFEADAIPIEVSLHNYAFSEYMIRIEKEDWEGVAELMLSSADKLAKAGADLLIAPCNIIHHAFEIMLPRSPLPWLHIADELALESKQLGYKKVGVLGTKKIMEGSIYLKRFDQTGIEQCLPDKDERERIDKFIIDEMVTGHFTDQAREYFLNVINRLKNDGCDAVGLCCTEIPILLRGCKTTLPLLDSTRILAIAALKKVQQNQMSPSVV